MRHLLAAFLVFIAAATAAVAGPSMSSAWLKISVTQDECVRFGSDAVRGNRFTTRFEVLGESSIYGERGDYTALVRCAVEQNVAFFVVAGPTGTDASRYMNAIRDHFDRVLKGEPAPPAAAMPAPSYADRLPGQYSVTGTNPNGSSYRGEVTITTSGDLYVFRWRIADGTIYNGRGRLKGRVLTIDWGQSSPVIYNVGDDGVLRGKWARGQGSETLTPE